MNPHEREAVATLCLMAAFADGHKDDGERSRLRSIFANLGAEFAPERYERVVLGQASLGAEAERLTTPALRTLAYEMAVAVCDADGRASEAEQAFLAELRRALGLDTAAADEIDALGDALATAGFAEDIAADRPAGGDGLARSALALADDSAGALAEDAGAEETTDAMILRYAILCGGLELLPQKLATLAVVPLQTKMVHRIGRQYGRQLDASHAKELLATVGLGITSQVVETYARGLFSGLAGTVIGKPLGKKKMKKAKEVAAAAAGSAFAFAATYALGHVAKAYYGGGPRLGTDALRGLFDEHIARGRALYEAQRPAIEAQARATDLDSLLAQLRLR